MNKFICIGNLTKDAELNYIPKGDQQPTAVVKFGIAVNSGYGNNKRTDFLNVVSFGAEKICEYLVKGTKVAIDGEIRTGSYEGKDGVKHYTTDVKANSITLLGSKNNNSADAFANYANEPDIQPINDDGDIPF